MKKIFSVFALAAMAVSPVFADVNGPESEISDATASENATAVLSTRNSSSENTQEKGLIETVAKIEKKTKAFNLYLNMHGDFRTDWTGDYFEGGKFEMKQIRVEAKGDINNWLSYRYRQRFNKGDNPGGYFDNILKSIDIAGFGMKFGKWQMFLGKQCADFGGIEFDLNPIEIYQYSDMIDYMENFLTGVSVGFNATPNQQFKFQILNGYNTSSAAMYGALTPAKLPLLYTVNWNGNFNNVYKTRWSASFMNETKDHHMWYFALGNEFNFSPKTSAYFDWMYTRQGADRKGIITEIVTPGADAVFTDVAYNSFVLHFNHFITPKWNIFAKGMYETASVAKTQGSVEKGRYRTSWGYIGGIEYYPMKDRNLHFFLAYVGRRFNYSPMAQNQYGMVNYNTNRLSVGFIWQMPVF